MRHSAARFKALLHGLILVAPLVVVVHFECPADAASLRQNILLRGDKVRLSDLFSGLPPGQDAVLGDAPALGESYLVGGPQLTAIAAQYGVEWPDASPLVNATVTHGAHIFGRDYVETLLRHALHISNDDSDIEVELDGFKQIAVPLDSDATPRLTHVTSAPNAGGRFSALLTVDLPTPIEQHLNGDVTRSAQAVMLRRAVHAGDAILADNIAVTTTRADSLPDDALQDADQAVGLTARVAITPDRPLGASQLVHPTLIQKNSPVVISYRSASLRVTASGYAMESGGRDDMIRVVNPSTRMVVVGRVADRSLVEIIPGMTPMPLDSRNASPSDLTGNSGF